MKRVYADYEEKLVKTTVLYAKSADKHLCVDSACTEGDRIDKDALMNLLMKGLTISYDGAYYRPISFKDETTHVSVVIATGDTTLTGVTLTSKESA